MTKTARVRGLVLGVVLASCAALPAASVAQASTPTLTTNTACVDAASANQIITLTATGLAPNASEYPQLELTEGVDEIDVGYPVAGTLDADANGTGTADVSFDPVAFSTNGGGTAVWAKLRDLSTWDVVAEMRIPVCGADTTPPVVTVPADIAVDATSAGGAAVSFSATATDDTDGAVPVTCDHASGSTFPVGTTGVTCSATDAAGNAGSGTFNVVVRSQPTPQQQLQALLAQYGFHVGLPLPSVWTKTACNTLNAFVNQVQARTGRQPGKVLMQAQGDRLVAAARLFAAALGCR